MTGWSLLPTIDRGTHRPCHRTQTAAGSTVDLDALPGDPTARVRALEQIVERQAALLEREDEVHRVLVRIVLAGGALAELGDAVAGFFGGAAVVTTTDGRVLAMAGGADEVERTRALECFDRTGRLLVESEPVGPRDPGSPGSNRAFVKIVAGSSDHGLLGAFSPERPLTAADVHLLERAATVAALAITKEQAVAAVEGKYRAEFLRDALAGRAGEAADAVSHAASLGWDLSRPMVVVVAETDENDEETPARPTKCVLSRSGSCGRGCRRCARATRGVPSPASARRSSPFCRWAPTPTRMPCCAPSVRSRRSCAATVAAGGGASRRGSSRPITSAADLPGAYDEALKAVHVGRQMHGESALTHFDGLGIYRLLALIPDGADLHRFVEESLGELATDDSAENADLRNTLSVLLDTNLNVAETARQLFFHYNTLRYRIAKLERMLGPFTSDPQLRLTLRRLRLRIRQMRGISPGRPDRPAAVSKVCQRNRHPAVNDC